MSATNPRSRETIEADRADWLARVLATKESQRWAAEMAQQRRRREHKKVLLEWSLIVMVLLVIVLIVGIAGGLD